MRSRRGIRIGSAIVPYAAIAMFLGLSYATLLIASFFTRVDSWYEGLEKPSWTPPGWLIGTIWTTLYTLIGLAAAIAWFGSDATLRRAIFAWILGTNLALNAAWSLLFFTLHWVGVAALELALLGVSTVFLMGSAYVRRPLAGYLLVPYAAWTLFAGFLNLTIWRLNG